jgi:uncharacterized DUF497 family protein
VGGRSETWAGGFHPGPVFEWDPNKSASNKAKHGVEFEEAKVLWSDPSRAEELLGFASEPRWATTAMLRGKMWTAIWTPRDKAIRIISVRRASRREMRRYGAQAQQSATDQR